MFYLIDKPLWLSSFDVIRKLRKLTGIRKMGHTGTLDPLATGCLLVATENSTKLISRLEKESKSYTFTVDISKTSPSLDLGTPTKSVNMENMREPNTADLELYLLHQNQQVPPKYSALHVDGKRAYDLVREDIEFELSERSIEVSSVRIINISLPIISIDMTISSGGYVRSFAPVIAEYCWVHWGGCITALRRTRVGDLQIDTAQGLENFDSTQAIPYSQLFPRHTVIHIESSLRKDILNGKIIPHQEKQIPIGLEAFLACDDILSLVANTDEGWQILRNLV